MVCFLSCAALISCTHAGENAAPTGELRIAIPINPTQLNPILAQNSIENFADGLIFDLLVTQDERHRQVPDLAAVVPTVANGGISKDGLTITYHLRHGVRWQDGYPFSSRDVKFTWEAIMNRDNNVVSHRGYDQVAFVDTPDPYTVVFHMKRLFAPAIDTIFGESDTPFRILPAHLLAKYANVNQVPFNAAPVGTGPFTFGRWFRGDRIILKANPNYFRGAPRLRGITLLIIQDDNTTESEVRSRDVDLALEIPATIYRDLANAPSVVRQLVQAPLYESIDFNLTRPPLNDPRVRRALVLAMDRNTIARDDTYGAGIPALADLSAYYWAFDSSIGPLQYNPKLAQAMLDQAGWHRGSDGVRTRSGKRLTLELAYGLGNSIGRAITAQVQQMYRALGIDVQLKGYDYATYYAAAQSGGILNGGKFDLAVYAWISGADPDNSSQWTCNAVPPVGNNVTRYCSTAMDAAQRLALSTFDRSIRKNAYARIERLLIDDAPAAFLYYRSLPYAHTPALQNFVPNGISEGWNAQEWIR
ncbi:MAG: peptide ABC transporter substrate-binding protein [Candidatus Eremiobacteraeota bacterium]|nr:peptide ABC transporter substrate-binding protein [Candidatus Eremiobacteraeota bacterium]